MRRAWLTRCIAVCAGLLVSCGQKGNDDVTITEKETQGTTAQAETTVAVQVETTLADPAETKGEQDGVENQLRIIADNKEMWLTNEKLDDYTPYSYAVTDLNQDGRLEIIESTCQGTGIFTTTNIYEVDEETGGFTVYESLLGEFDSEADLAVETADVYYDKGSGIYHYIFKDFMKNGVAENYENIRDWALKDAQIVEKYLAYQSTLYDANGNATVSCEKVNEDGSTTEITEEEYAGIAEKVFEGLQKKVVHMKWEVRTPEEGKAMSEDEMMEMLWASWSGFRIE